MPKLMEKFLVPDGELELLVYVTFLIAASKSA